MEWRKTYKDQFEKKHGVKLGMMSPFIKAAAFALKNQPVVNAVIDGNEIIYRDYIDVSVAVAAPKVFWWWQSLSAVSHCQLSVCQAALGYL